ncbi:MAG: ArsR family transcriptional regulator [Phycisphaerales bacterium]|nr:MAG: ArsR family transcriptional regulator [Phycisphaerales bacterium]
MTNDKLTTREKILYLLRRHGPMTAQELGKALRMSVSGVRQHTSVLEKASLVSARVRRQKLGRPGHEYVLSPESEDAFPKGYKELALGLLVAAQEIGGDQLVRKLVDRRRTETYRELVEIAGDLPLEEKLTRVAEELDKRGQITQLRRENNRYKLLQYNCLTHELSAWHPAFCESDRRMYEKLMGRPVKLEQCRAKGADYCCLSVPMEPKGDGEAETDHLRL